MFHSRKQQPDEDVMTWYSQMRKIGANCAFDEITSDEIYRDHLVSGVYKDSVREKLLERRELALDIIRNSEIQKLNVRRLETTSTILTFATVLTDITTNNLRRSDSRKRMRMQIL